LLQAHTLVSILAVTAALTAIELFQAMARICCTALRPLTCKRPATCPAAAACLAAAVFLQYEFGPYPINANEVFAKSQLSFAFVNLKPIVPGAQM
jgi:hypothetical protein